MKPTENEIKVAYDNYCDSRWTPPKNPKSPLLAPTLWGLIPIEHSLESFTDLCLKKPKFYKKYTKKYPTPFNKIV